MRGANLRTLFENAARALTDLMLSGDSPVKPTPITISVSGDDLPDLMVRWLTEVLYLLEGEGLVVTSTRIRRISSIRLEAALDTVPYDPAIHERQSEVKAVTYHQIEVARRQDHWESKIIFDV